MKKQMVTSMKARGKRPTAKISKVSSAAGGWGIKRRYIKTRKVCKVTFRLPVEAVDKASKVNLVGDFNNWNTASTPLNRLKNGDFSVDVELSPGREYRFRYLVDGSRWENDWCADKYVPNEFGTDDSVLVL